MASSRGLRSRYRDRDRIRFGPDGGAAFQLQTVHGDLQAAAVDFYLQVVVIHFVALERIVLSPIDLNRTCSGAAGHKVGDAAMLVTFVVVHVSGKNDDSGALVLLPRLQHPG